MFRFLNEINEEIAREEKLLKATSDRILEQPINKGYLLLRGPKGNKTLVKQTRYVDEAGNRKSEEAIIGALNSKEAINYIGQAYHAELAKRLNENLKNLKQLATSFKPFDMDTVISGLPELFQPIMEMSHDDSRLLDAFSLVGERDAAPRGREQGGRDAGHRTISRSANGHNENSIQVNGKTHPNNGVITSSGGMMVRSKSEAIICSLLNQYSIEYIYEGRLELRDEKGFKVIRMPDFTIKTKRGIIIWEHLGLLDNDEYFATNADKLRLYWRNGFVLNENLIVTVDEPGGGINARTIDCIIKDSIVPYI